MKRRAEPEVMDGEEQAHAYAQADFTEAHNMFVTRFCEAFPEAKPRQVVDLGCGSADISVRFAHRFSDCHISGMDASEAMLRHGQALAATHGLENRINLIKAYFPDEKISTGVFDTIISNSLLHHLRNPMTMWQLIKQFGCQGTQVFVMDLLRPQNEAQARAIVDEYARDEPAILQHDFYHSLLAAYTIEELETQLSTSKLSFFNIEQISDRHFTVHGEL